MLPAHVIRCNEHMGNGGRCKREAEPGSVVCRLHGGAASQVRKRAAERLIMSADHVSQKLLEWLDDPEVPYRVRAEIAQDLLDRAGLIATQVHKIIPTTEDPIMRLFEDALSDPRNWEQNPPPAIESYATRNLDHHDAEPDENRFCGIRGGIRQSPFGRLAGFGSWWVHSWCDGQAADVIFSIRKRK
jgi:hypothetical protein